MNSGSLPIISTLLLKMNLRGIIKHREAKGKSLSLGRAICPNLNDDLSPHCEAAARPAGVAQRLQQGSPEKTKDSMSRPEIAPLQRQEQASGRISREDLRAVRPDNQPLIEELLLFG
jgi:hypothetical protein